MDGKKGVQRGGRKMQNTLSNSKQRQKINAHLFSFFASLLQVCLTCSDKKSTQFFLPLSGGSQENLS